MVPLAVERKFICLHYSLTRLSFARIRRWSHMCFCIGMEVPLDFGNNCPKLGASGGIFSSRTAHWFCLREGKWGWCHDVSSLQRWQTFIGGATAFEVPPLCEFPLILCPDPLCRHSLGRVHSQLLKREIQPERANFTSLFLKSQGIPKWFRRNADPTIR